MSGNEIGMEPRVVQEVAPVRRSHGTLRRRAGLGIAMSGVLAVAAGGVFVGVANAQAAADDARSLEAVADAAASLDELPPVEPVVPADPAATTDADAPVSPAAGVDYSQTPEGWYDATTDPADIAPSADPNFSDGIWAAQQQIIARCMADQGFWYAWANDYAADQMADIVMTESSEDAWLARWGTNPSDQPYDWRLAGCHGHAVHVTGMDEAH
ncbi:hypothetical protein [Plantibacter sp. RU18]|uniref:hypothetical protein n=1 Tax=Plantibacter sp. RU18 TaxID=3158143 RepID=UPI003D3610CB